MFLCNSKTQRECIRRKLFASPSSKWLEVSKITRRTAIFLYTLGQYPMVRGIFVANKAPFFDCSGPYKAKFPVQVKVRWYHQFQPMPSSLFRFGRLFGGDGNRERKLSKRQTQGIIACFVNYLSRGDVCTELTTIYIPTHAHEDRQNKSKTTSKYNAHAESQMLERSKYLTSANVLMYNGQLIPVYNPRGILPVSRALPPLEPNERSGSNILGPSQI